MCFFYARTRGCLRKINITCLQKKFLQKHNIKPPSFHSHCEREYFFPSLYVYPHVRVCNSYIIIIVIMMSIQHKKKAFLNIYQERVRLRVKMRRQNGRRVLIMFYYVLICEYDGYTTQKCHQ